MDQPGVAFARAQDGAYLAYQVFGEGPIDLVWQDDFLAIVDEWWDSPPDRLTYEGLAEFARVIVHDRRGIGSSSREGGPANLETRVSDTLAVMDAVGSERPVVGGLLEGGASLALLAATHPDRVRSLVWVRPVPRAAAAPDYPWGATPAYVELDKELTKDWGTEAYARGFMELNADAMEGPWSTERYVSHLARLTRQRAPPTSRNSSTASGTRPTSAASCPLSRCRPSSSSTGRLRRVSTCSSRGSARTWRR